MSGPVIIKIFDNLEELTAEDVNSVLQSLANRFGAIEGTDFIYPFLVGGDFNLSGGKLLRAREIFDVLNLEEYGSDETAADQAIAELTSGGMILIPRETTVQLGRGIKIRRNRNRIWIAGQGHTSKIQMQNDSDDHAITVDGCFRYRISNLQIDGNRDNMSAGHGIWITDCEDFEINNVWVGTDSASGVAGSGIVVANSKHFSIKRSWVRNPRRNGILIEDNCEDFAVSQVFVSHANNQSEGGLVTGEHGVAIRTGCRDGVVDNCTIYDPTWNGINLLGEMEGIKLVHNRCRRAGVDSISGKGAGISFTGESDDLKCTGITVLANVCSECVTGINIGSHTEGQVMANYCRGNSGNNMTRTDDGTSRVTQRDNQCMEVAHHGKVTFLAGQSTTDLDIGVSNLPIQAIVATWNYDGAASVLQNSVLGARYAGQTITFFNASPIGPAADAFYSIEA